MLTIYNLSIYSIGADESNDNLSNSKQLTTKIFFQLKKKKCNYSFFSLFLYLESFLILSYSLNTIC
jgi:hypothetical protein